jgi:rare lipoprotein A
MTTKNSEVRRNRAVLAAAFLPIVAMLFTGCASTPRSASTIGAPKARSTHARTAVGIASYYGKEYHGRTTASGEIFDMTKLTAAHRSLPFGINVRVTNLSNDQSVVVRVNDRGPFVAGRIIDLSLAAAQRLGMIAAGLAKVKVEPIDSGKAETKQMRSDADSSNGGPFVAGEQGEPAEGDAYVVASQTFSLTEAWAGQNVAGVDDGSTVSIMAIGRTTAVESTSH